MVLLRRQLRNERPRRTPWLRLRPSDGSARGAIWRRSWRGIARTPAGRLVRMAGLAGGIGLAAVAVLRGTTPAFVAMGILLFLIGLEAVEPLSQEIDQPGLTDGLPIERGRLHVHLLVASAGMLVPFAALGATVVAVIEPDAAAAAFALALPIALLGMAGAVVSTVRDAAGPCRRRVGVRAARVRRVRQRDARRSCPSRSARSVHSRCWPRARGRDGRRSPAASSGSSSS